MAGVFSWNDVNVLLNLNFDLELKVFLSKGHKLLRCLHHAIDRYHFIFSLSMFEKSEWNFSIYEEYVMILPMLAILSCTSKLSSPTKC